jgi:catechol 2,3-dioxygenase-like lactoylglutathione lyase family enzyme
MPIEYLQIVSVPVRNQDQAKHFYVHGLGWELLSDEGYELAEGTRLRWLEVRPHGGQTAITLVLEDSTVKAGLMKGLILRASSLDSTVANLASRGVTTEKIQETPWARYTSFQDPDGNTWIIQEIRSR